MTILRKALKIFSIFLMLLLLTAGALWLNNRNSISPAILQHTQQVLSGQSDLLGEHTPGELIRYVKRRLEGHPNVETVALRPLHWVQAHYERPVPEGSLPTLGKGQQKVSLLPLRYSITGQPLETVLTEPQMSVSSIAPVPSASNIILVSSPAALIQATKTARSGQTIVMAPGTYRLKEPIDTYAAGTSDRPIFVKAVQPGQVTLEFSTQVAFRVSQPYWVFENLHIRGVCDGDACEHAFHIYGGAQATVVRNNLIEDFNAHLKINGIDDHWPDFGLIQYNTLTNTHVRETSSPVIFIDLVGANQWHVSDNIISNFVITDPKAVAYGVFMKGASSGGRIERNLVVCTLQDISQPGERVGISFGGGTTGPPYCRDHLCTSEHTAGMAANNIVAHCNDYGIDVNRSNGILIAHNTLINTAGIDVRGAQAHARLYGNLFEGYIRLRTGGQVKPEYNTIATLTDFFQQPDQLLLDWRTPPENIPSLPLVPVDFYGHARLDGTFPGAITARY